MKLKNGFLLRTVAGRTVIIPDGDTLNLNLMITLNDTGRFLWELLEKGATAQELKDALTAEYEVDEAAAGADVDKFIEKMKEHGFLEE